MKRKVLTLIILSSAASSMVAQNCPYLKDSNGKQDNLFTLEERTFFQKNLDDQNVLFTWSAILYRDMFPNVYLKLAKDGDPEVANSYQSLDIVQIIIHLNNDTSFSFSPTPYVKRQIGKSFQSNYNYYIKDPEEGLYFVLDEGSMEMMSRIPVKTMEFLFRNATALKFDLEANFYNWKEFKQPFHEKDYKVNPQTFFMRYLPCISNTAEGK